MSLIRGVVSCIITLFFIFIISIAPTKAQLKITGMTLYPSSSTIFFRGKVDINGTGAINLLSLPETAAIGSVTIKVEQGDVALQTVVAEDKDNPVLERMKQDREALLATEKVLNAKINFILGLLSFKRDSSNVSMPNRVSGAFLEDVNNLRRYLDGIGEILSGLMEQVAKVRKRISNLETKIKDWQKAHRWMVRIKANKAGNYTIDLSYTDNGITWTPKYEAHLDGDAVDLRFDALVHVASGQVVKGVKLAFSTARPMGHISPPRPTPLFVRPLEHLRVMKSSMKPRLKGVDTLATGPQYARPDEYIHYQEGAGVALFSVSEPVDLFPEEDTVVHLKDYRVNAEVRRVCYSGQDPRVYILAQVKDLPHILPPGRLVLYQGKSRVGETRFEARPPLKLSFGVDQGIRVKRMMTKRFLDEKFGGKVEVTQTYETTLYNIGNLKKVVEVVERVPVSQDERIIVSFKGATPYTKPDSKTGFLRWKLTLAPKGAAKVNYSFSIKYPKDMRLNHWF